MSLSPILAVMEKAARKAGETLLDYFSRRDELIIETKGANNYVSRADRHSEEIIVGILNEAYPGWGMLGEEGTDQKPGEDGYRWIIDPLDATRNFLHGISDWSVTIALEKSGEIIAGLTYDIIHEELFYAEKGQGAYLNGKRLQLTGKKELAGAVVNLDIGFSRNDAGCVRQLSEVAEKAYLAKAAVVQGYGMALGLAYIAAGRCDITHGWSVYPWDFAAGVIIVKEAGGIITDLALSPVGVEKSGILAGNAVLHSAYAKLLGLN